MRKTQGKLKKKKNTPTSKPKKTHIGIVGQIIVLHSGISGIALIALSLGAGWRLYHHWHDYQTLQKYGELRTVPLIELEKDTHGRGTSYFATYQITESLRTEAITSNQYRRLKNQDTVDILIHDDLMLIADSRPNYFWIWYSITLSSRYRWRTRLGSRCMQFGES